MLGDQRRGHIARRCAFSPTTGIVENLDPRQLRVKGIVRRLLPRLFWNLEDYVDAMPSGFEAMPWMVWTQAILPVPMEIPDSDVATRNRRIDEFKGHEPAPAVNKFDSTGFDMIFHAGFDERDAGIIAQ